MYVAQDVLCTDHFTSIQRKIITVISIIWGKMPKIQFIVVVAHYDYVDVDHEEILV